jgi:hypothetical protein
MENAHRQLDITILLAMCVHVCMFVAQNITLNRWMTVEEMCVYKASDDSSEW